MTGDRGRDDLAIELRGICKRYGRVTACQEVDLSVAKGTVHAVVGENGAGKSTLMKIAYGQVHADSGAIVINGTAIPVRSHSPSRSIRHGVGMVHQHFMLVDSLTAAENIVLGNEPLRGPFIDLSATGGSIESLGQRFALEVEPSQLVGDMSVGQKQRVELLKVLHRGASVLILDEPTAVLGHREVSSFLSTLRTLVEQGTTVVIVTHKIDEVVGLADAVTVMRQGAVCARFSGDGIVAKSIARAMVGRLVELPRRAEVPSSVGRDADRLVVESLHVRRRDGSLALAGVSLRVAPGEIVGIAGVDGNGQRELLQALAGLHPITSGAIVLNGQTITTSSVLERGRLGLSYVPEDRQRQGLILDMSVEENLILGQHQRFRRRFWLDETAISARAEELIREYDVRPEQPRIAARALSGGNQQKLVVARELARSTVNTLLCAQPTRGVDIAAIEIIHQRLLRGRDVGMAVVLVSSELSELCALCDRIVVMYRGRIVGGIDAGELADDEVAARDRLGQWMAGIPSSRRSPEVSD